MGIALECDCCGVQYYGPADGRTFSWWEGIFIRGFAKADGWETQEPNSGQRGGVDFCPTCKDKMNNSLAY